MNSWVIFLSATPLRLRTPQSRAIPDGESPATSSQPQHFPFGIRLAMGGKLVHGGGATIYIYIYIYYIYHIIYQYFIVLIN